MRTRTLAKIALPLLGFVVLGFAPAVAQSLTYEQARTAMDAAEQEARSNQWNLTIVVADAEGVPIIDNLSLDSSAPFVTRHVVEILRERTGIDPETLLKDGS